MEAHEFFVEFVVFVIGVLVALWIANFIDANVGGA